MTLLRDATWVSALTLGMGLAHQAHATVQTRRHHAGFEHFEVAARSGNLLSCYRRAGRPGSAELVLETGLMNTSSSWLLLASLLPTSVSVTVYDRAGYGRSLRRSGEPYHLGESASDAVDLVNEVRTRESAVWLIGHSIGGYLAHRATVMVEDVDGLVLIDPMHPRELAVSRQQREGARSIDLTLGTASIPIAFGAGALLDKGGILRGAAGNPFLKRLRSDQSAYSTWRTGLREWRFTYPIMLAGGAPLERLDTPVYVISAQGTIENSPEQLELYDDYVTSGAAPGQRIDVPDCDHLSIINGPEAAQRVASLIDQLVSRPTDRTHEKVSDHAEN